MTSGIIIIIEHAGTDIDPVPYVRYIQCRSNNLGSLYAGSLYLSRQPRLPSDGACLRSVRLRVSAWSLILSYTHMPTWPIS